MTTVTRTAQKRMAPSTTPEQPPSRLFRSIPSSNQKAPVGKSLMSGKLSSLPSISAYDINRRASILFPGDGIIQGPCILARIFAAYSLVKEQEDMDLSTPQRATRHAGLQRLTPILPLLQSLVMVESISLAGGAEEGASSSSPNLVSFSGIDCSSVQPPVDRVGGSGTHQHDSIQALLAAKEQVEALVRQVRGECAYSSTNYCNNNDENSSHRPQIHCLESLVEFLQRARGPTNNNSYWVHECARAIHSTFPPQRVVKAATLCQRELSLILKRLFGGGHHIDDSAALMTEKRLSELVGQAIRYHLRLFFNSAPPRLSPEDVDYENREQNYSQVNHLIVMTMKDNYSNAAVDDECFSALISNALCRICEYFGLEVLLDASAQRPEIPPLFCANPVSNVGFRVRGPPVTLSTSELDQVLSDIDHAYSFLAMTNACRFLIELLNAPGVQDEIDRQGGWSQVETYASFSWKHQLWKLCPDDQHLVCLSNFNAFKERLQTYLAVVEGCVEGCEESLAALAKRFHTTTKSKNILGKFPQIPVIAHSVEEGQQRAYAFPRVEAVE